MAISTLMQGIHATTPCQLVLPTLGQLESNLKVAVLAIKHEYGIIHGAE